MGKFERLEGAIGIRGFKDGYSKGTTKRERIQLGLKAAASQIIAPSAYNKRLDLKRPLEEGRWRHQDEENETRMLIKVQTIAEPIITASTTTGAALLASDHIFLAAGAVALEIGHRFLSGKPPQPPKYYDVPGDFSIDQDVCISAGACEVARSYLGRVDVDGVSRTYVRKQPEDEHGKKRMVAASQVCPMRAFYFRGSQESHPDIEPYYSNNMLLSEIKEENESELKAERGLLARNIQLLLRKKRQEAKS